MDREAIEEAVGRLLAAVGEDPGRAGLAGTPARVARMYEEIFSGIGRDPADEIDAVFTGGPDDVVVVRDIALYSTCEHHLTPFAGKAHIAYLPRGGRITGISKLARVVDVAARRPQVQEQLTAQIADALEARLEPRGLAVVVEAEHLCMTMRGVRKPGAVVVTSALRGVLRDDAGARDHALSLIRGADVPSRWRCRGLDLPVGERVHVMGVLNVTPDSFSDGGLFSGEADAVRHGVAMAEEGADIIDVGGESTRPGAAAVGAREEAARVVPVVRALARAVDVPISIDTTKAAVAEAAVDAGAVIVNDVSALRVDPAMAGVAASCGAGVVLMHMLGNPRTMQADPRYGDVVAEVRDALLGWARDAEAAGIGRDRIVVDPGIGFGKTVAHNLSLLRGLGQLVAGGYPVLVGPSRKSFIGTTLGGLGVDQRVEGTAAAVAWSVAAGARIVRVHDVRPMVRVVRMTEAILGAE